MDLDEVVRLAPIGLPNLLKQRPTEVEELVLLKVPRKICLLRVEVIGRLPIVTDNILARAQPTDEKLLQHIVGGVRVLVLLRVLHDGADVPASEVQNEVVAARVVCEELRDVVNSAIAQNPAVLGSAVGREILLGVNADALGHGGREGGGRREEEEACKWDHHILKM